MSIGAAKADAEILNGAGVFMMTVAGLVEGNLGEKADGDGKPFMTDFHLSGLMIGLKMISHQLCERGEFIADLVDREEMALAAQQRRQGRDKPGEGTVGAECGTRRAA